MSELCLLDGILYRPHFRKWISFHP